MNSTLTRTRTYASIHAFSHKKAQPRTCNHAQKPHTPITHTSTHTHNYLAKRVLAIPGLQRLAAMCSGVRPFLFLMFGSWCEITALWDDRHQYKHRVNCGHVRGACDYVNEQTTRACRSVCLCVHACVRPGLRVRASVCAYVCVYKTQQSTLNRGSERDTKGYHPY